jgi:hypothetical protein
MGEAGLLGDGLWVRGGSGVVGFLTAEGQRSRGRREGEIEGKAVPILDRIDGILED